MDTRRNVLLTNVLFKTQMSMKKTKCGSYFAVDKLYSEGFPIAIISIVLHLSYPKERD